jgi:hypothetical protein
MKIDQPCSWAIELGSGIEHQFKVQNHVYLQIMLVRILTFRRNQIVIVYLNFTIKI